VLFACLRRKLLEDKQEVMMNEFQPLLPLDQRFRNAEQYAFDFDPIPQTREGPKDKGREVFACIGYCNICPRCGNSNNRDKDDRR